MVVAQNFSGDGFGGISIQKEGEHSERKASIIANTACEILQVEASCYRKYILQHEQDRLNGPLRFFESVPEFSVFDREELVQLAWNAIVRFYAPGTSIFEQGRAISDEHFFGILKVGVCRVYQKVCVDSKPNPVPFQRLMSKNSITTSRRGRGTTKPSQTQKVQTSKGDPKSAKKKPQRMFNYELQPRYSGSLLSHRNIIVDSTTRTHPVSICAETCAEVVFLPRNAFFLALRKCGRHQEFFQALPTHPTKERASQLAREKRLLQQFQARLVKKHLQETPKGRIMMRHMARAQQQRQAKEKKKLEEGKCDAKPVRPATSKETALVYKRPALLTK